MPYITDLLEGFKKILKEAGLSDKVTALGFVSFGDQLKADEAKKVMRNYLEKLISLAQFNEMKKENKIIDYKDKRIFDYYARYQNELIDALVYADYARRLSKELIKNKISADSLHADHPLITVFFTDVNERNAFVGYFKQSNERLPEQKKIPTVERQAQAISVPKRKLPERIPPALERIDIESYFPRYAEECCKNVPVNEFNKDHPKLKELLPYEEEREAFMKYLNHYQIKNAAQIIKWQSMLTVSSEEISNQIAKQVGEKVASLEKKGFGAFPVVPRHHVQAQIPDSMRTVEVVKNIKQRENSVIKQLIRNIQSMIENTDWKIKSGGKEIEVLHADGTKEMKRVPYHLAKIHNLCKKALNTDDLKARQRLQEITHIGAKANKGIVGFFKDMRRSEVTKEMDKELTQADKMLRKPSKRS